MARKKKKTSKHKNEKILIPALVVTVIVLICLCVFLWGGNGDDSTVTISPDGTSTVLTAFEIEDDSWCEQNPVFCGSDGLIDRAMCWMPSSAILPAARSGSCWAITTMEISWFHLKQKLSFLPDLHSICESTPLDISRYLAGIQQNRKAVDNVLASLMSQMETSSLNPAKVCEGMKQELLDGDPVLVVIVLSRSETGDAEAAHAVVAYGYEESTGEVRFLAADSNTARAHLSPEMLVFDKSNREWNYEASYHPEWYNLSIGFLKISSLGMPSLP